jgi:predicted RNA binding protein YcfA (HicA-like mRNA interferase family)
MSQWNKLIDQILKEDKNLRYDDLSKALQKIGYKLNQPRGGSSHVTFRKTGKYPITIPRGNPVNAVYIKLVREVVEQYLSEGDDNG